jgi:hypothetical protein
MHRMDPYDAVVMFDKANLKLSQQGVVKKHLQSKCGKKLFIPDYKFRDAVTKNIRPPHYGVYEYMSADAILKKQRQEKVNYWAYNTAEAVCNDVEAMVNELGDVSSLADYQTHKGLGWVILLRADNGKGAWRCHTKLYTHSAAYRRQFQDARKFKKHITSHESGARLDQVAHITCKKDHPLVLENTVTTYLDASFATTKSSQLVVL